MREEYRIEVHEGDKWVVYESCLSEEEARHLIKSFKIRWSEHEWRIARVHVTYRNILREETP